MIPPSALPSPSPSASPAPSAPAARVALAADLQVAGRVLVVDDEETIRLALGKFLRGRGYAVTTAASATEALAHLGEARFELMLCDVRMPGMSGTELLPHALAVDPDLGVLFLSAVNDAPTAATALSTGALDYLTKPVELAELQAAVERVADRRLALLERKAMDRRIREEVALRTAELEREQAALRALSVGVVETLVTAQEAKDVCLRGHSQRVADLAATVALELGLGEQEAEMIRLAGRLHDVGKIGIREEVLNKPGRLTAAEFEHVKDHVRIGIEILAPLRDIIGVALQYVQDHHEHLDGRGYPRGVAGDEISLGGRVLCCCDAFDALTCRRPYREPLSTEETFAILERDVDRHVDARVLAALRAVIAREGWEPGS